MTIKNILFIILLAAMNASQSLAQPWSGIIDPSRAVDWSSVGVKGGIQSRSTICSTLNPGATLAQINAALANCPAGQVVFLSAGTYNLGSGSISIDKDNVSLRGAGADQTKLYFKGRGSCTGVPSVICVSSSWISGGYGSNPQNLTNWTNGYDKGSLVLTFASTAGLKVGNTVVLDQIDDSSDSSGIYVCGKGGVCSYTDAGGDVRTNRHQRQLAKVEVINGNQVTIDKPLTMPNWRASQNPQAHWVDAARTGVGVENLSIDLLAAPNTGGSQSNIVLLNATDSWVQGVRSVMADRNHINIYQSTRITVKDNYLYGSFNGISTSYGVETFGGSNFMLIENNMIQHNTAPIVVNDGDTGSVYAYNFSIDDYRADNTSLMSATMHVHSPGVSFGLWEGNDGLAMVGDNWYGTTHFQTLFRNHLYGDSYNNPAKSAQTAIFQIAAYNRFYNFVGNVLGKPGYHTVYEPSGAIGCGTEYIFCFGYSHATGGVTDAQTKPRAFRWGNYDTATGTSRFVASEAPSTLSQFANPVPANQSLPASFYLANKPDFFGSVPWPPIGPDVTGGDITGYAGHANKIPARLCWEGSKVDSEYGNRNIRTFNTDSCYGGSSSSIKLVAPSGLKVL